jgi:hypothetical protein
MAHRGLRTMISGRGLAVAVCFTTVVQGRQGTSPDLDQMASAVLHLRPIGLPGEPVAYSSSTPATIPSELIPAGARVTAAAVTPSSTVVAAELPADLNIAKWRHDPPPGWTMKTMTEVFAAAAPATALPWSWCRDRQEASFEVKTFARNPRYLRIQLDRATGALCSSQDSTVAGVGIPLLMLPPTITIRSFEFGWSDKQDEREFRATLFGPIRPVAALTKNLVEQMTAARWTVDRTAEAESTSSTTTLHTRGTAQSTVTATLTLTARDGLQVLDATLRLASNIPTVHNDHLFMTPAPRPVFSEDTTVVLHADQPVDRATTVVLAFLNGPFGFSQLPPREWRLAAGRDVVIPTTYGGQAATSLKAIVYAPGFALARVDLPALPASPKAEESLRLVPLATIPMHGHVDLSAPVTSATIHIYYSLAPLVTDLLYGRDTSGPGGPATGGTLEIATVPLQPDGSFSTQLPDLVHDPVVADVERDGRQRFFNSPVIAGSIPLDRLSFFLSGVRDTRGIGMTLQPAVPIQPSYPDEIRLSGGS